MLAVCWRVTLSTGVATVQEMRSGETCDPPGLPFPGAAAANSTSHRALLPYNDTTHATNEQLHKWSSVSSVMFTRHLLGSALPAPQREPSGASESGRQHLNSFLIRNGEDDGGGGHYSTQDILGAAE